MKPLVALPLYCVMRPKQSTGTCTSKSEEMWVEQDRRSLDSLQYKCHWRSLWVVLFMLSSYLDK